MWADISVLEERREEDFSTWPEKSRTAPRSGSLTCVWQNASLPYQGGGDRGRRTHPSYSLLYTSPASHTNKPLHCTGVTATPLTFTDFVILGDFVFSDYFSTIEEFILNRSCSVQASLTPTQRLIFGTLSSSSCSDMETVAETLCGSSTSPARTHIQRKTSHRSKTVIN